MTHVPVVDDNPDILYLLRVRLKGHGMAVTEARHGVEAPARAAEPRPDLVMGDRLMPAMDGDALLRR